MIDAQVKPAMKLNDLQESATTMELCNQPNSAPGSATNTAFELHPVRSNNQAFAGIVTCGTYICTGTLINPTATTLVLTINRGNVIQLKSLFGSSRAAVTS
jgi:hypothetical protein